MQTQPPKWLMVPPMPKHLHDISLLFRDHKAMTFIADFYGH